MTPFFLDPILPRIGGSDAGNYFYSRDHLGSIREVTDSTGALKAQYDYDAYGNAVVVSGNMNVDFGFTGHYFHQPSDLNLAMYRAYNPTFGRWISRDPIGERGGLNLYCYVGDDPENRYDPFGDCWCSVFNGHTGHLTVNCNCQGKIRLWVIDEHNAPAAGAICGMTVEADGFVLDGSMYKIDGSTCVEIDCSCGKPTISACVNNLVGLILGKTAPYVVPWNTFGASPKTPPPGSSPPIVR